MTGEDSIAEKRVLAALAIVLVAIFSVFAVYSETFALMVSVWLRSDTFAHGLLIIPVMVYLLYRARYILVECEPEVKWFGLVPLAVLVGLWLTARIGSVDVVSEIALIAMIPVMLMTMFGFRVLAAISFPVAYLIFAVPTGEFLLPPLIEFTTNGTVFLLQLTGIPAFQDGRFLTTPTGNFNVEDACSGLRYLIGATAIGVLFAYFFLQSWVKRIVFLCVVIFLTIFANVFRAYLIVVIAHLSDMRLAVGVDHFIYGWVLFGVLLAVIFLIGLRYSDSSGELPLPAERSLRFAKTVSLHWKRFASVGVACIAVLFAGPLTLRALPAMSSVVSSGIGLPGQIDDAVFVMDYQRLPWLEADPGPMERHSEYRVGPGRFFVQVLLGSPAMEGRDASSFRNRFGASEFRVIADDRVTLEIDGKDVSVNQLRLRRSGRDVLVNYWFVVGDLVTANSVVAKFAEVWQILSGGEGRTALVSLAIEERGLDDPEKTLHTFTKKALGPISKCLVGDPSERMNCRMPTFQGDRSWNGQFAIGGNDV